MALAYSLVIIILPSVFNLATAKEQNVTEKRYVIALKPRQCVIFQMLLYVHRNLQAY